jgi:hypothetical protein
MGKEILIVKESLLGQLERNEPLDNEKLSQLRFAFENASHDGPCPCESGQKFSQCCKLDWVCLRDRSRGAPEVPPVEEKGNGDIKEAPAAETQWICRVGLTAEGGIAVEPLPHGAQTPPIRIAELLLGAYHVVNFNATIGTFQAMLRKGQARTPGPAVRSAFGN